MMTVSSEKLRSNMERLEALTDAQALTLAGELSSRMELEAKRDAPWTDRTGNARRTLEGFAIGDGEEELIYSGVAGNMPYSPSLEYGHFEKYAILRPVVGRYSGQAAEMLAKIFLDMGGKIG